MTKPPARPALYGVIGDPVSHSLSPLIHNGWIHDHGLKAHYQAIRASEDELSDRLESLSAAGCMGVNITLPHKQSALELADTASDEACAVGAANTLARNMDGGWHAENTDAPGFMEALGLFDDMPLRGRMVYVLGAGGSARAVLYALDRAGAQVVLCNRTLERARTLIARHPDGGHRALTLDDGISSMDRADLVINTTSLGHSGRILDWPRGQGRPLYDISYGKAAEIFLAPAARKGWRTSQGLGMLVAQAARSFELWFGICPDRKLAHERCKLALEAAG